MIFVFCKIRKDKGNGMHDLYDNDKEEEKNGCPHDHL